MRAHHKLSNTGIAILTIALLGLLGVWFLRNSFGSGRSDSWKIEAISVYSVSGKEMAELSQEDMLDLARLLDRVEVVGEGSDPRMDIDGNFPTTKMFLLELADGSSLDFGVSGDAYRIDEKTEYEAADRRICHDIYLTYYSLIEKYLGWKPPV